MMPSVPPFLNHIGLENYPGCVLSGQQCGLLGGSTLVLSKILGVATMAQQQNLLPVYWVETNDSDFQEINFLAFFNRRNEYEVLRWKPKALQGKNYCIGDAIIDDALISLLNYFFNNIPETKNTKRLRTEVFKFHKIGFSLGNATLHLMQSLCKPFLPTNFVFFNPMNSNFIKFSKPYLLSEAENTPATRQCYLFAKIGQERHAIFKKQKGSGYQLRNGKAINLSHHLLLPHLKTRSIIQDAYFNAKHYIAGASEKQYLQHLLPRYSLHKTQPAKITQRMHAIVLSKQDYTLWEKTSKHRSKNKTNAITHSLLLDTKKLISLVYNKGETAAAKTLLRHMCNFNAANLRSKLKNEKNIYINKLESFLPKEKLKQLEKIIHVQNKHIIGKMRTSAKREIRTNLTDLKKISQKLHPTKMNTLKSGPQERSINFLSLLNLHGNSLMKKITDEYSFSEEKLFVI